MAKSLKIRTDRVGPHVVKPFTIQHAKATRPPRKLKFSAKIQHPKPESVRKGLKFSSRINPALVSGVKPPRPPRKGLKFSAKIQHPKPSSVRERPILRIKPPKRVYKVKPLAISDNRVRPGRKLPPARWRKTLDRPEGFVMASMDTVPDGCEAWIALDTSRMPYTLMPATKHKPDHVHDAERDYWVCNHPKNASSWVAAIGIVVLDKGGLGLFCQFWSGVQIAYVFNSDDDVIYWYQVWKSEPSKGKAIRGKFGPSYFWHNPYVKLKA